MLARASYFYMDFDVVVANHVFMERHQETEHCIETYTHQSIYIQIHPAIWDQFPESCIEPGNCDRNEKDQSIDTHVAMS